MTGWHQLTNPGKKFAEIIVDQVNKDFVGMAITANNCCYIKNEHYEACELRVQDACNLKEMEEKDENDYVEMRQKYRIKHNL